MSSVLSFVIDSGRLVPTTIEVTTQRGLPGFHFVGLPLAQQRQIKQLTQAIFTSLGLKLPALKIIFGFHPAVFQPNQDQLQAAIVALLIHKLTNEYDLRSTAILGCLNLSGALLPARGVVAAIEYVAKQHQHTLIIPDAQKEQVYSPPHGVILSINNLKELTKLDPRRALYHQLPSIATSHRPTPTQTQHSSYTPENFIGQEHTKQALTTAIAGNHNLVLIGPPGYGKSQLIHSFLELAPELPWSKQILVASQRSLDASNHWLDVSNQWWLAKPPVLTIDPSTQAWLKPKLTPRLVSTVQHGFLVLEELPLFSKENLHNLQALIDAHPEITVIASCNPCACGWAGSISQVCRCSPHHLSQYWRRVSGALWDRFAIQVFTDREFVVTYQEAAGTVTSCSSGFSAQITQAHHFQQKRWHPSQLPFNGKKSLQDILEYCAFTPAAQTHLNRLLKNKHHSWRKHGQMLALAQTIADKTAQEQVDVTQLLSAQNLQLPLDQLTQQTQTTNH